MIIYKITNKVNNKVYIGKTIRSLESRFKRHLIDALSLDTHFARAIRQYGNDAFEAIQIDSATTEAELNLKEQYWIDYYKAIDTGYNTAMGGIGGNTYKGLTEEELSKVKQKISTKNLGRSNGQSKQIKCKSVITLEEHFFDTLTECLAFFNLKNKAVIMDRVNKKTNLLWRNEWLFAFENEDYPNGHIYDPSTKRGQCVELRNNDMRQLFTSIRKAADFLGVPRNQVKNNAVIKTYKISFLS